ncbi:ABC transporter permease [Microbacterium sp. Mu-80]|uniref:ABC transporter permease n=1 Tax=Microbacterium bandirmense TaxID=3122050 RepID=A0ABU8LDL1_9MICO
MTAIQARATYVSSTTSQVSFVRQLRSEFVKLLSVRGTWWSVAIVAALTIGIGVLLAANFPEGMGDPIMIIVSPVQFTMMLAGILGVISVTGEYSTGMIRSTLAANPVRGSVLAAKAAVLAVFMFVVSLLIFIAAMLIVTPFLVANDLAFDWADPSATILPVIAASATMSLFALIGVGLGFLLRSGAAAIAATVGIIFVLPVILTLLSAFLPDLTWLIDVGNYLPASVAASAILPTEGQAVSAGASWLTLGAWAAAALASGWVVLRGRDA